MILQKSIEKLKNNEPLLLVAIGDSLTYGWMTNKCFLDYLFEMIKKKYVGCDFEIINKGIPGNTAFNGLYRLEDDVLKYNPDLVFVQFALNEVFCRVEKEDFKKNISLIINKIKNKSDAEILLMTSNLVNIPEYIEIIEEYYDILEIVANDERIPIVKVHNYWKKKISEGVIHGKLVQTDQVHPTALGYSLFAEAIMEYF